MFVDLPQDLILFTAGAFFIGWLLGSFNAKLVERRRAKQRDPRDDRIRELEAELRIAQGESARTDDEISRLEDQLKETTMGLEKRDIVITEQMERLERAKTDLKESVIKTRELRAELAERATENVHAEAKIREVETELSVARASTDLIATGALQYASPEEIEESESANEDASGDVSKTAL